MPVEATLDPGPYAPPSKSANLAVVKGSVRPPGGPDRYLTIAISRISGEGTQDNVRSYIVLRPSGTSRATVGNHRSHRCLPNDDSLRPSVRLDLHRAQQMYNAEGLLLDRSPQHYYTQLSRRKQAWIAMFHCL